MREAIEKLHVSGDGHFTKQCHSLLEQTLGCAKALLTTSGTHALELAALLLEMAPGDEFILPSFTFVSTANAFVLRGAKPVFVDVRPDTLNLDESLIEARITERTKAIVVVHYAGVSCEMESIQSIAGKHGLAIVEDNAHGLFGRYKGQYLGTFGRVAALSFHETKNFHCGEGGALILNDPELIARGEVLREKGTNRSAFFRGEIDKYSWVDIGSSYLPSDLLAAFLYAQLEVWVDVQQKRREMWEYYWRELKDWAVGHDVQLPAVPSECDSSCHLFHLVMPSPARRQALMDHLKDRGISTVFHYLPLHLSRMGKGFGGRPGQCPVTERVSECLVRLPLFNGLTEADQSAAITAIKDFS